MKNIKNLLLYILYIEVYLLLFMSLFRFGFFIYFNEIDEISLYYMDLFNAFFLGFRIDLTVIGYIQLPLILLLVILYYSRSKSLFYLINKNIKYYFFIMYIIVFYLLLSDFGFYSYFKEHINILYFGILDDDTYALILTLWDNYNVPLIIFVLFIVIYLIYMLLSKLKKEYLYKVYRISYKSSIIFLFLLTINALMIRGSFGMYPLGKVIPNISNHDFINKIPQNGVRAFVKAYKIRKKYEKNYNLISNVGYKDNIEEAFRVFKNSQNIKKDLIENITYTTSKKKIKDYNLVVIMVESFGMPILKYQSEKFNIMGALKKHFDDDIVFTNFISSGDGTIPSLESMILNIPYRIGSFSLSQSKYRQTEFSYSPAFVFNNNFYKSSFIYGGDLSWREIGSFAKYQGYENIIGKIKIYNNIKNKKYIKENYFHPWGIFDEYLYDNIYEKLLNSQSKQNILALSTNNHPPYNIPVNYKSKSLIISKKLKEHITSDIKLIQKRFESYAYALDSVGKFMNKIKASKLKDNTIVVITADNNTIEGNMKYNKNKLLSRKNIPFYMYIPKELKDTLKIDTTVYGSHKDIYPTLYNILLSNTKYISVGTNMLDTNITHIGVNASKIIISKNKIIKAGDLSKKSDVYEVNYYRSLQAISQYLLDRYKPKLIY